MPQTVDWYQSVAQAKAQFTMWALMSAPLLIAADPGQVEPELLSYWGNEEILEVSQTFREGGPYYGSRAATFRSASRHRTASPSTTAAAPTSGARCSRTAALPSGLCRTRRCRPT